MTGNRFIVIEGLEATGKFTLVAKLAKHLAATLLASPPKLEASDLSAADLRLYFDERPPAIVRRSRGPKALNGPLIPSIFLMQSHPKANAQHTVDFIRSIQRRRPGPRLLIFWDGASYHRQQTMRDFSRPYRGISRRINGRYAVCDWLPIPRKKIPSKIFG